MIYEKTKAKDIISDNDQLKSAVSETLRQAATIVGATLGPGGRPVLIERDGMPPLITKDGVTVAKSLGLAEAEKNIIIESAKEICVNTAKEAGDGTTTAIVLANAIVEAGQEFLFQNKQYNPQRIVNELNQLYKEHIVPLIDEKANKDIDENMLRQVAMISANGDKEIADLAVEAVMSAGDDGVVLFDEAQGKASYLDAVEGFVITNGLKAVGQLGSVFINDEENQQNIMEKGLIFLYDGTISSLDVPARIQELIEGTEFFGKPIILVAHKFTDNVIDRIAKTYRGGYNIIPCVTPMSGLSNSRTILLKDIAAYTSASIMDKESIENMELDDFGDFDSAHSNMFETIISAVPDEHRIEQRVHELKKLCEDAPDDFSKMHLRAHISRLTGGISTLFIGGVTNFEIRERKDRAEDAVEAVRSAIAEGVIPGGCSLQQQIKQHIKDMKDAPKSYSILIDALDAPLKLLLSNCGYQHEEIIPKLKNGNIFDAYNHKIVDPFKAGIIEPAKVCRVSLANALSVASLLITLGGIVVVPRDIGLENQLAMQKQTFSEMMAAQGE